MSYRASFTKCIETMQILFQQDRYEFLYLVHCPKGKYYTVYTQEEMDSKLSNPIEGYDRLVMAITRKELTIATTKSQQNMFEHAQGKLSDNCQN